MAHMSLLPYRRGREMQPFQSLQHEVNDLFDSFWRGWDVPSRWGGGMSRFSPSIDVSESKDEILVTADLPGMDEKDVEVEVAGDLPTIRGEKKDEKEDKSRNWHAVERSWGSFERAFTLPHGTDLSKATASFNRGVLKVSIPKTADAKAHTRRLEIKSK